MNFNMRNLPSAISWLGFVYFIYLNGFHWIYLVLLMGGLVIWEYPVKENVELIKEQIERTKAETENLKWITELNKATTKLNIKQFEILNRRK